MSFNLLESISGAFNSDMISKAASSLGENESSVSKVVGAAIPTLLSGIMSTSKADGGATLFKLAKQATESGILDNLGSAFSGAGSTGILNTGASMLSGLLGNKVIGLTSLISNFAGVKQSTTNSILSAVVPVALSFIGKHAIGNNLSASGLLSWLTGQKSQITNAIPSGLNLSSVLDDGTNRISDEIKKPSYTTSPKSEFKWLWPLLLGILGLALILYFWKGCNQEVTPVVTDTVAATPPEVKDVVVTPVRESLKVKLPNGTELDAFKGGIEDQLVTFLNDAGSKAGKDVWFDFDNLNFETGSAAITTESQSQIKNIAAILAAYPKLKIKIGGYTDKSGYAVANKELSQKRADAVVAALTSAGANAGQLIGAEGYGSEFAKVPADASDEERKTDRRISIGVREK